MTDSARSEEPAADAPVAMEVAVGDDPQEMLGDLAKVIVRHPLVRVDYPAADLWLVNLDVDDKYDGEDRPFRAVLNEMTSGRVVEATGRLGKADSVSVHPTSRESLPREEEHGWALDVVRRDETLAAALDAGEVTAYHPIPPLASVGHVDGTAQRVVTVGLRQAEGEPRHRVVGVRSSDGSVEVTPEGVHPPSDLDSGLAWAQGPIRAEGAATARVRITRGDEELWDLVVVRPAASSGTNGSGVELRHVSYLERPVLARAHVPIVNTQFHADDAPLAATREWLNEEASFDAEGEEGVEAFRVCAQVPRTVAESGADGGDFNGVALHLDGDDLVVVSQMKAGWNRYAVRWRLGADGVITPGIAFAEAHNPATAGPHTRHAYFRFDFDVTEAEGNQVQEHNDPTLPATLSPWVTAKLEARRVRNSEHDRRWRVRHYRNGLGYTVVPGPSDGEVDDFGAGDVWLLAQRHGELDDGQGFTTDPHLARAQLDRLVSGEHLGRTDLVVWYAVHCARTGEEDGPTGWLGPRLEPFNWKAPSREGPFAPLVPPSRDEPLPVIPT